MVPNFTCSFLSPDVFLRIFYRFVDGFFAVVAVVVGHSDCDRVALLCEDHTGKELLTTANISHFIAALRCCCCCCCTLKTQI